MRSTARGFTLLEVAVAMVLIGFGLSLAFAAMSGAQRLSLQSRQHEAAMLMARARMDEILVSPDYTLAEDGGEEQYAGIAYAFKIEVRPIPLLGPAYKDKIKLPVGLDELTIHVYWGPQDARLSYSLTAYRFLDPQAAQAQNATATAGAPPGTGAPAATTPTTAPAAAPAGAPFGGGR